MTSFGPALALVWALGAQAEEPSQRATFAASAEVVKVDVVVTDERGAPVRGLTRDDFTLAEDGVPQPVTLFEVVGSVEREAGSRPGVAGEPGAGLAPGSVATSPPTVVIVFDEPHLDTVQAEQARRRLREVLPREGLGALDVALFSTAGGGLWHGSLPDERAELAAALARFRGARPTQTPGRMTDVEAFAIAARRDESALDEVYRRYLDLRFVLDPSLVGGFTPERRGAPGNPDQPATGRQAVRAEAEVQWRDAQTRQLATLRGLRGLLEGLARRSGPKAIVLLSAGFAYDHALPETRAVLEAARRARASIHVVNPELTLGHFWQDAEARDAVDVRDAQSAHTRAMKAAEGAETLAHETGGSLLRSLPALGPALEDLAGELRAGYLLGFAPPSARLDGRYHKLSVKTRRPGLRLRVRPGYFALEPGAPSGAEEDRAAALAAAFDGVGDVPLAVAAFVVASRQAGRLGLRVVAESPAEAWRARGLSDDLDALVQVVGRERNEAQYRMTRIKPPSGQAWLRLEAQFDLPPGAYQVQALLRAPEHGGVAGARVAVDVPGDELPRLATLVLSDELADGAALPRAVRRFSPEATLHCLIEVLEASDAGPVNVALRIEDGDGRVWLDVPSAPLSSPRSARQWSQPLAGLPEGVYSVVARVEDAGVGRRLTLREAFEVTADEAP